MATVAQVANPCSHPLNVPPSRAGDVATQEQRNQTAKYESNPGSNSERVATRILTCLSV